MNNISVANDIIPIGQFKSNLSKYLEQLKRNNNSLIITRNGMPAGVVISPIEFDNLMNTKLLIESITRGLNDVENGKTYTTDEVQKELQRHRAKNKK